MPISLLRRTFFRPLAVSVASFRLSEQPMREGSISTHEGCKLAKKRTKCGDPPVRMIVNRYWVPHDMPTARARL